MQRYFATDHIAFINSVAFLNTACTVESDISYVTVIS